MWSNVTEETITTDIPDTDIVFACQFCEKSLSIAPRGAGLMITCPDCGKRIQVPEDGNGDETTSDSEVAELSAALATSQAKVQELVQSLQEVYGRRDYLEKLRVENLERLDRVGQEMTIIQAALDRIVGILQDADVNQSEPTETG